MGEHLAASFVLPSPLTSKVSELTNPENISAARPRIMDKHLAALSKKYFGTRFIKLSAPVRPWHAVLTLGPLSGGL